MLTYSEAMLFVRFGEDMRLPEWPAEDFVRLAKEDDATPSGYEKYLYSPNEEEVRSNKWRRA